MEDYNKKTKILFFHFDLGGGGAEKVLVDLVNNLDPSKYDITVHLIFNHGVYKHALKNHIKIKYVFDRKPFRATAPLAKLFSPSFLHKVLIKDNYDIEIAFFHRLPLRIISGSKNKRKFAWVHTRINNNHEYFTCFRNLKEAKICYYNYNKIAFVSENALESFLQTTQWNELNCEVVHNVVDSKKIIELSHQPIKCELNTDVINLCSVGRLTSVKGFDRLIRVLKQIYDDGILRWHLYILGKGEDENKLHNLIDSFSLHDKITLLGFDSNPHKYVSKMDLFVCSSYDEGYSTAVTESVILGIPVLTTDCSGMKEILGDKAGCIVPNDEKSLYDGLKKLLLSDNIINELKKGAISRSKCFSMEAQIKEFETFIFN